MWSDWLGVCDYGFGVSALWCPLAIPTILLGFLLPWMWGIYSRLLQQSAATGPYLGRGVSPHGRPSWPWMWSSSSWPSCTHAAAAPWMWGSSSRLHWKDWCWSLNSNTLATSCEELTHWKRPWCWEGLRVGGEGDDRGWDGWMASLTRWARVWVDSGSWWWTGRPGMLWFMGSQRVGHDWVTELNWTNRSRRY